MSHAAPILLLGGTGQLGRALQQALGDCGPMVVCRGPHHASAEDDRPWADLAMPDSVRQLFVRYQPRLVINAAAFTAVDRAEQDAALAQTINGTALSILAEESLRTRTPVVHFSTDYVFDGTGQSPWKEDQPAHPLNVYGRTKLAGDRLLLASGASCLVLRISWVYSADTSNFVTRILERAGRGEPLRVVDDQFGSPTPARLVAQVVSQLVRQAGSQPWEFFQQQGGLYHLACSGCTSWYGLAVEVLRLAEQAGWRLQTRSVQAVSSQDFSAIAVRPRFSQLDCARINRELNISLPGWCDALHAEFRYFKSTSANS